MVGLFQGEIARFALLAVLMPIVSGMGGNAGTQTLAVVVRALATNQLTNSNTVRMILREFRIAAANGAALGLLIGTGTYLLYGIAASRDRDRAGDDHQQPGRGPRRAC